MCEDISMEEKIYIEGSRYPVLETFGLSDLRRVFGDNCSGLEYKDDDNIVPTIIALNENGTFIVPFGGWMKAERKYFIRRDLNTATAEQLKSLVKQIQQKYHKQWKKPVPNIDTRDKNDIKHRRKYINVHFSWCHWDVKRKAYVQVYLKDGGGPREVQLKAEEATYKVLFEKAVDLYFPHGVSNKGPKAAMEICSLGDSQRNVIHDFIVDREQCTYPVYLRKMGLVPSKCRLHLLTKDSKETDFDKEESATTISTNRKRVICDRSDDFISAFMIEGTVSKSIQVKYCKDDVSTFSEQITTINASSLIDCARISSLGDSFLSEEEYHPLTDFHVRQIAVGQEVFLEYDIVQHPDQDIMKNIIFSFPKAQNDAELILHGPDEINGYECDVLVIGIVSSQHGSVDTYTWYCDGAAIISGVNMCIMQPNKEGTYHCVVENAGNTAISKSVMVVKSPVIKKALIETHASKKTATRISAGGIDTTMEKALFNPNMTNFGHVPTIEFDDIQVEFDEKNKLGEGVFGTLYKGQWLGTDVAIKSLKLGRRNHLSNVIENEVKVLGKIRHPNIIQIMATSSSAQKIHILCEYIDGFNLEEIIFEGKKEEVGFSTSKKPLIALHAAKGLAYLHGMNPPIIHQDVKPANYLVEKYTLVTKLCDLGVSRMRPLNATHTMNINVGAGTPGYMAPEILLESCKSTSHSDIWSYGICLLELLTENEGWKIDESTEDVIEFLKENMLKKKCPDAIENIKEVCASDTEDVIRKLLTYDPCQRLPAIEVVHHFQKLI